MAALWQEFQRWDKCLEIGAPADIYEHPATPFVSGFVGISNLVQGELARRITGSEQMFSIRPEKIHLSQSGETTAEDMYGKLMSIPDSAMPLYFQLLTRIPPAEINLIETNLTNGNLHPRDAKMRLALHITSIFYGEKEPNFNPHTRRPLLKFRVLNRGY